MGDGTLQCRRCGAELRTGLVASGRRACCLNATPIVGACPTHGPLGPHHATGGAARMDAPNTPDGTGETDEVTESGGGTVTAER
jgi:hypothetical protein